MVKNYYLAGGFMADDKIASTKSFFKRPDLVDVPAMLEYDKIDTENDMIGDSRLHFYLNSMGACIFLVRYGLFSSDENMWKDYRSERNVYNRLYASILEKIADKFSSEIKDVDWIMPVLVGADTDAVHATYISLKNIDYLIENSESYHSLSMIALDAMIIFQSTTYIGSFFKSLPIKGQLTKYEQYQISFYVQGLKILENPSFFLTNVQEINLMKEYYQKWDLEVQIKTALEISANSIQLFEFLSRNTKDIKNQIANLLMSFLSLVLLYEPISDLVVFLFPAFDGDAISMALRCFVGVCSLVVLYKIVYLMIDTVKEKYEYKGKSKR